MEATYDTNDMMLIFCKKVGIKDKKYRQHNDQNKKDKKDRQHNDRNKKDKKDRQHNDQNKFSK